MVNEKIAVLSLPYAGKGSKTVRVYVPAHEEGETFPVIYMTDGQNLFEFEPERGQFGSWYADKAVLDEQNLTGRAAVIVGIHNDGSPMERTSELTPVTMSDLVFPPDMPEELKNALSPQGEIFDDFVINTVMPAVESQFPVKTGKKYTAFCGSSSGGLQSFFTVLSHQDKFSMGGVFSPALMMYEKSGLERWIRSKTADKDQIPFLYMYTGGADGLEQEIARDFEWLCGILEEQCLLDRIKKSVMPEQPHHESAWENRFRDFIHIFLSCCSG